MATPTARGAGAPPLLVRVLVVAVLAGAGCTGPRAGDAALPAVTLTAVPGRVGAGEASTLTWGSTGATGCVASGGWSGSRGVSGTEQVTPAVTTTYTLGCTGPGGSASGSVTVTVGGGTGSGYVYPLQVGPTGRYLVDQQGTPFFLAGDAAWSLIAQLADSDADAYLADRAQRGFTLVLANLIEHQFATHAPADIYGLAPFTGRAFATPNEAYFAHADHVLQAAAQQGLVVLLDPLYLGYACGSQGWCAEVQAASTADLTGWGRYVGTRYRDYDNLIWLIGGDTDPTAVATQVQAVVDGIRAVDTRHLMTAHNARGQMAVAPWPGAAWLTVNDVYTGSSTAYQPGLTAYHRTPVLPYFLIEAIYENEGATAQELRAQAYWTVLSGGFGQVFGNCPMWGLGAPQLSGFCSGSDWRGQLGSPGAVNMQYLQRLFRSRHWQALVPDEGHGALTAGYGSGTGYATAAVAADSSSLIAYLPTARAVTVSGSGLAGGTMTAWWYQPGTGGVTLIGTYPTTGPQTFSPPASGDWVLVVDSPTFNFPAPGSP
jgi:hypothetical protein